MPNPTDPKYYLKDSDYDECAKRLGCEKAAIMAVAKVESNGCGFYEDGFPRILFEGHLFSKLTKGKFDASNPTISYPKWTKQFYGKTDAEERARLEAAVKLDRTAALMSCSWGTFQILGQNFALCGCKTVQQFVNQMCTDAKTHLLMFTEFIINSRLDDELRDKRFTDFARLYNGPAYAANSYDVKIQKAYAAFKAKGY